MDPLDGTKEFIQRHGEFTVNIALIEDGVPVLGVVFAPALILLYWAGQGLGAWKREAAARPERIYSRPPLPGHALRVAESRSHPSAELEEYLKTIQVAEPGPGGELAQVLLGGGGQGRHLSAPRPDDGVGRGRRRLHLP